MPAEMREKHGAQPQQHDASRSARLPIDFTGVQSMNFTYLELSRLKMAATKLLETASQLEAVNITTSFNSDLIPTDYVDRLMDEIDSASETIMQVTAINGDGDEEFITANSDRVGD